MRNSAYPGVVRAETVVFPTGKAPLAEGTEVMVSPIGNGRGSPATVLAAIENAARVPAEWIDELESAIAQGRRRATLADPFADDSAPH